MEFEYKGKKYDLGYVVEPNNRKIAFDIAVIYTDEMDEDMEVARLVDWFYLGTDDIEEMIRLAKMRIDYREEERRKQYESKRKIGATTRIYATICPI